MKFSISHKTLSDAATWACHGLTARPVVPVLEGITVTAGADGMVTLAGFDYEDAYTMRVPADVAEPGTALVPGKQVKAMLKSLPKTVVTVELDGNVVMFRAGTSALSVATMPAGEYPAMPSMQAEAGMVDAATLRTAILQVTPAVSRDGTLPTLTCVSVEAGMGALTLAATDRYRLHTQKVPWVQRPASERAPLNIPAKPLTLFAKSQSKVKPGMGTVTVHAPAGEGTFPRVAFTDGVRTVNVATMAGEFPRWQSLLPEPATFTSHLTVDAQTLAGMVQRMGALSERNTPVLVTADDSGTVTVETRTTAGVQASSEVLPGAVLNGEPVHLLANAKYFADMLSAHTGTVELHSTRAGRPALAMSDGSTCRTLVMTMREPV